VESKKRTWQRKKKQHRNKGPYMDIGWSRERPKCTQLASLRHDRENKKKGDAIRKSLCMTSGEDQNKGSRPIQRSDHIKKIDDEPFILRGKATSCWLKESGEKGKQKSLRQEKGKVGLGGKSQQM